MGLVRQFKRDPVFDEAFPSEHRPALRGHPGEKCAPLRFRVPRHEYLSTDEGEAEVVLRAPD